MIAGLDEDVMKTTLCYMFSFLLFVAAVAILLLLDDKGHGIFAILLATVLTRVLILNVAYEGIADADSS